jgi:predicted nucleic acid-binding protein
MLIADTSALYALFSQNDVHHKEAVGEVKTP